MALRVQMEPLLAMRAAAVLLGPSLAFELVEQGTHDELLAAGGVYSGLYKIQHHERTSENAQGLAAV